jgi:hypothetical protein
MKFVVTLQKGEDGFIIAECPALPGCITQGLTNEEALANIREAIAQPGKSPGARYAAGDGVQRSAIRLSCAVKDSHL